MEQNVAVSHFTNFEHYNSKSCTYVMNIILKNNKTQVTWDTKFWARTDQCMQEL